MEWTGEEERSLDCETRGGRESEDEGGDSLLGRLRKLRSRRLETGGGGGWEGPLIWESFPRSREQV